MSIHALGPHFRRQHPIDGRFIVDSFSAPARLCIEIDGDSHVEPEQAEYDAARAVRLGKLGVRLLRFTNAEVDRNLEGVVEAILDACREPPPQPSP